MHVVHPSAADILGVRAVPTVADLSRTIDLAVICVPAERVCAVAEACGEKGVRGLLVISAGFAESPEAEGKRRSAELAGIAAKSGMRILGPNSVGFLNASRAVLLNAIFAVTAKESVQPVARGVALLAQSGALGIAVMEQAQQRGLPIARFASLGNKLDVSANDLLMLWGDDPGAGAHIPFTPN